MARDNAGDRHGSGSTNGRRQDRGGRDSAEALNNRALPHNLDAEKGLLAACIIDGGRDTLTDCVENKLTPEAFFKREHQLIFEAMMELYQESQEVDEIIISERLQNRGTLDEVGGIVAINEITSAIETTVHAPHWLSIVQEKSLIRRLIRSSIETVEQCYEQKESIDQFLEQVEQKVFEISQDRVSDTCQHIKGPVQDAARWIQQVLQREGDSYGVRTGYHDLDAMTYGFHAGQMIVLAARPSVGKTSLAMNFAEQAVMPGSRDIAPAPTLVFSLEMTSEELAKRLLTCRARVKTQRIRDRSLANNEQQDLARAAKEIMGAPLYIDDSTNMTILELRAKARRLQAKLTAQNNPLGFILIDYLQLLRGSDSSVPRQEQVAEISRGVKGMAKELGVPVMVASQLNRESERERRDPRLSDLRESGAIEQDADMVMILHRPRPKSEDEEGGQIPVGDVEVLKLIIAKQRNGPVGDIELLFNRSFTRFENYASDASV